MAKLRVTLLKSPTGYAERQKRTVRALGLHRLHQTVEHPDNEQIRGMVRAVRHLVKVDVADDAVSAETVAPAEQQVATHTGDDLEPTVAEEQANAAS